MVPGVEGPSDPIVFGDWDPDDRDDDDGEGLSSPVRVAEALDAYCAALVETTEALGELTRAFHAPGCEQLAQALLMVNGVEYDELRESSLVPAGQVYVTTEPDMETLEVRYNDWLRRDVSEVAFSSLSSVMSMHAARPKFTLLMGGVSC